MEYRFGRPHAYHSRRLVVSTTTGRVHRADCAHAVWIRGTPVVPLRKVPDDARPYLRACGNCDPPWHEQGHR